MAPRTPKTPDDKPAKPAKPAAKAPAAKSPALKVVDKPAAQAKATAKASAKAGALKLKALVDQVAAATGTKKPEAKKSVEATLAALAAALQAGSDLALPPLGKLRVAKSAGGVLTLKLRQASASKGAAKPLADDGEDD